MEFLTEQFGCMITNYEVVEKHADEQTVAIKYI
jgi:hypothetical protein